MGVSAAFQGLIHPLRCLFHPFDGFTAVKDDKKGSVIAAVLIILLFFFSALLYRQNTGYAFNHADLTALNLWLILTKTVVLYGLWVAGNWAVATWMEGEGKAVEIIVVSAYAIIPYVTATFASVLLSNVLVQEEGAFLTYIVVVGQLWSIILMIIGLMIVHDYGFVRTLQSMLLTLAVMGVVIFLAILFYTLFQQLYVFFYTIYNEMLFRL